MGNHREHILNTMDSISVQKGGKWYISKNKQSEDWPLQRLITSSKYSSLHLNFLLKSQDDATKMTVYSILFCHCLCYSLAFDSCEFPLKAQKN